MLCNYFVLTHKLKNCFYCQDVWIFPFQSVYKISFSICYFLQICLFQYSSNSCAIYPRLFPIEFKQLHMYMTCTTCFFLRIVFFVFITRLKGRKSFTKFSANLICLNWRHLYSRVPKYRPLPQFINFPAFTKINFLKILYMTILSIKCCFFG